MLLCLLFELHSSFFFVFSSFLLVFGFYLWFLVSFALFNIKRKHYI